MSLYIEEWQWLWWLLFSIVRNVITFTKGLDLQISRATSLYKVTLSWRGQGTSWLWGPVKCVVGHGVSKLWTCPHSDYISQQKVAWGTADKYFCEFLNDSFWREMIVECVEKVEPGPQKLLSLAAAAVGGQVFLIIININTKIKSNFYHWLQLQSKRKLALQTLLSQHNHYPSYTYSSSSLWYLSKVVRGLLRGRLEFHQTYIPEPLERSLREWVASNDNHNHQKKLTWGMAKI